MWDTLIQRSVPAIPLQSADSHRCGNTDFQQRAQTTSRMAKKLAFTREMELRLGHAGTANGTGGRNKGGEELQPGRGPVSEAAAVKLRPRGEAVPSGTARVLPFPRTCQNVPYWAFLLRTVACHQLLCSEEDMGPSMKHQEETVCGLCTGGLVPGSCLGGTLPETMPRKTFSWIPTCRISLCVAQCSDSWISRPYMKCSNFHVG